MRTTGNGRSIRRDVDGPGTVTVGAGAPVLVGVGLGGTVNGLPTGRGVAVGVAVGVSVGVAVGVSVGVAVGVSVGVAVGVSVGVAVGVSVGVSVGVAVGSTTSVGPNVPCPSALADCARTWEPLTSVNAVGVVDAQTPVVGPGHRAGAHPPDASAAITPTTAAAATHLQMFFARITVILPRAASWEWLEARARRGRNTDPNAGARGAAT
jgi:hypothetical protein